MLLPQLAKAITAAAKQVDLRKLKTVQEWEAALAKNRELRADWVPPAQLTSIVSWTARKPERLGAIAQSEIDL